MEWIGEDSGPQSIHQSLKIEKFCGKEHSRSFLKVKAIVSFLGGQHCGFLILLPQLRVKTNNRKAEDRIKILLNMTPLGKNYPIKSGQDEQSMGTICLLPISLKEVVHPGLVKSVLESRATVPYHLPPQGSGMF